MCGSIVSISGSGCFIACMISFIFSVIGWLLNSLILGIYDRSCEIYGDSILSVLSIKDGARPGYST